MHMSSEVIIGLITLGIVLSVIITIVVVVLYKVDNAADAAENKTIQHCQEVICPPLTCKELVCPPLTCPTLTCPAVTCKGPGTCIVTTGPGPGTGPGAGPVAPPVAGWGPPACARQFMGTNTDWGDYFPATTTQVGLYPVYASPTGTAITEQWAIKGTSPNYLYPVALKVSGIVGFPRKIEVVLQLKQGHPNSTTIPVTNFLFARKSLSTPFNTNLAYDSASTVYTAGDQFFIGIRGVYASISGQGTFTIVISVIDENLELAQGDMYYALYQTAYVLNSLIFTATPITITVYDYSIKARTAMTDIL